MECAYTPIVHVHMHWAQTYTTLHYLTLMTFIVMLCALPSHALLITCSSTRYQYFPTTGSFEVHVILHAHASSTLIPNRLAAALLGRTLSRQLRTAPTQCNPLHSAWHLALCIPDRPEPEP